MRIHDMFMPGWSNSWMLSAAPPEENEERRKSWSSCWGYRQQIRWVWSCLMLDTDVGWVCQRLIEQSVCE